MSISLVLINALMQGFPNAVNTPSFPSGLLTPGQAYYHEVQYQFSTK